MPPAARQAWRAALINAVQTNCHIADARHAADMTLCTYLLQMREFYRWEQGIGLGQTLDRTAVGDWIATREGLWNEVEQREYQPVPMPGVDMAMDAMDADAVNAKLASEGLIYGAGLVAGRRPVFFLAERHAAAKREGVLVLQGGREYARCLLAPPAALAGGGQGPILVRRESLARWCWERVEAHSHRPAAGSAMQAMVSTYGLDTHFNTGITRWLDDQVETAVLHELGEHRVGQALGKAWNEMRAALLQDTRAAGLLVALRDHLADLNVTLPTLLQRDQPAPLHAWFAAYDGLRTLLWPDLPQAYAAWRGGDQGRKLHRDIEAARGHFEALSKALLSMWMERGPESTADIAARLKDSGAGFRVS